MTKNTGICHKKSLDFGNASSAIENPKYGATK